MNTPTHQRILAVPTIPHGPLPATPEGETLVTAIIPTYNNPDQLSATLYSLLHYSDMPEGFFRVIVVNNGPMGQIERIVKGYPGLTVIETGDNLGWEGGLSAGLKQTCSPLVLFLNDDIHVVPGNPTWLRDMVDSIRGGHPSVAAVGPTSNYVMGKQALWIPLPAQEFYTTLLIGFCCLVRRDVLDAVGGVAMGLPGGDDLDLSIRLDRAGWKMVIRRDVYMHHHGQATGSRVHPGTWNSNEHIEETRRVLIIRHGVKAVCRCMQSLIEPVPPLVTVREVEVFGE